jgi:hypothetical protein
MDDSVRGVPPVVGVVGTLLNDDVARCQNQIFRGHQVFCLNIGADQFVIKLQQDAAIPVELVALDFVAKQSLVVFGRLGCEDDLLDFSGSPIAEDVPLAIFTRTAPDGGA